MFKKNYYCLQSVVCRKNSFTIKLSEIISEFSKVCGYKVKVQNQLKQQKLENTNFNQIPFIVATKHQIPMNKSYKIRARFLHKNNTILREINEDLYK